MSSETDLLKQIEKLTKERDAYAQVLNTSNSAFMAKVKELSIIKRISATMRWNLDKGMICKEIVNILIDETTAENCSLWLKDQKSEFIELLVAKGQEDEEPVYFPELDVEPSRMRLGEGVAGWVAVKGESLVLEDASKSPHFIKVDSATFPVQSLMCLPIKGKDTDVIGVLNLSHPNIGVFSTENARLLELITDQAALAFTNIFLFEYIQELNKNLQELNKDLEAKVDDRTQTLQKSEARYALAVKAGKVAVWDWDSETKELYISPNLREMLGYQDSPTNLSARNWLRRIHRSDRRALLRKGMPHFKNSTAEFELELRMKNAKGEVKWFMLRGAAIREERGFGYRVMGSNTDITARKETEAALREAQQQAVANARAAGRTEFADSVLHNIGNVLNSVNVSCQDLKKSLLNTKLSKLLKANELMEKHMDDLSSFVENHPRGQLLPKYLIKLGHSLQEEHQAFSAGVEELESQSRLMQAVITSQQAQAKGRSDASEEDLGSLVDNALRTQENFLTRAGVEIRKTYLPDAKVIGSSANLIHIFINLIKNAGEAMLSKREGERVFKISMSREAGRGGESLLALRFSDNGAGIAGEHLDKLFTYGFTTKKDGHGFGLKYCERTIREMGGDISVASPGLGQGSTFTLLFPGVNASQSNK